MKTSLALLRPAALLAILVSTWAVAQTQTASAQPIVVVDGGTPGFYNNSLGTILDGSAPQFPLPLGSGGGDPLIYPSDEPNLAAATNQLGNWLTPSSTLNANWQPMAIIPATWAGNTETAIIYEVNGGANGFTNVFGNFDADNGIYVWVNGQFKFGARAPGLPSPAGQFEYTNVFLGNLAPGTNRIQILREDNFDATGYQVRITGNPLGGEAQTCAPASSGLVAWWQGDGSGADAIGTNTGSLVNGTGFTAGQVGTALSFNGTNNYVEVPDAPSLRLTNVVTIEFWAKRQRFDNSFEACVEKGGDWTAGQQNYGVALNRQSYHYCLSFQFAGGWRDAGNVSDGNWHHCAVVARNGDADPTFYIDGVLQPVLYRGGAGVINLYPSTRPLHLGAQVDPATGYNYYGKLQLDEVSIYNRTLSAGEIQAIYNAGSAGKCAPTNPPNCTPAPSGLIGWWAAEGNATDNTSAHSGTFPFGSAFATGVVGQAFDFDGSSRRVSIPDSPAFQFTNAMTLEAWIYPRAYGGFITFRGDNRGGLDTWTMDTYDSGFVKFQIDDEANNYQSVRAPLTLNQWQHVAATWDRASGDMKIYLNGALVQQTNTTIVPIGVLDPASEPAIGIGNHGGTFHQFPFDGLIDELAMFNRALTTAEIQAIYNAGSAGKCAANSSTPFLLDVDFGQGLTGSTKIGFAAIGATTNDFWNYYTRDDGAGGWRTFGALPNLKTVDGTVTTVGLTVSNAPGSWSNGSTDPMYVGYIYPLDGGNVTVTVTNLPAGQYDVLAYANDGNYEVVSGGVSQGVKTTLEPTPVNPPVWTPGVQYARFTNVNVSIGQPLVLTVRPGIYGYAIISGMQIVSAAATNIVPTPTITQQPQDQTVNANATAQFAVAAAGWPPLRYQWFFAGNPLPNATNALLSIPNALPVSAGTYSVAVSNDFGFAISSNATLTVLTFPPVITRQPTNVTVFETASASFSVQATGSVTLTYQWLFNDVPLAGKTGTTLSFSSAQFSNAGNYSVIVTNPYGAVTSSVATLTVNPRPPCAPVHDGLVSWWRGENDATDGWDSNNGSFVRSFAAGKVGRAINNTFVTVPDAVSLRVTNAITIEAWVNPSSVSGSTPRIIVSKFDYPVVTPFGLPPVDTQSAYLLGTTNNGLLFFTVSATGSARTNTTLVTTNTLPINQWSHVAATYDGTALRLYLNGTQAAQTNYSGGIFPGTANLGIGGILVGSSFGISFNWPFNGALDEISLYNRALSAAEIQSIVAADFTGKCLAPPVVTKPPLDQIIPLGEDVKFSVEVYGSRPLAYQWYFNGSNPQNRIIGATNAALLIEKVRTNNVGLYFVTVTNSVGSNFSARAQLSTLPAPSCTDAPSGLISWWPGDGNTADVMGLNNIASYSPAAYLTGKVERAFSFSTSFTASRILVNNSASLNFTNNQNFSIEMWIKATKRTTQLGETVYPNVPLLEKRDTITTGWLGYSLSLNGGRLAFALGATVTPTAGGRTNQIFISSGPDLRDSMFHHVAVTLNRTASNGGVLYVDGAAVLVFDPRVFTNSLVNTVPLYIGAPATTLSNSYFSGLIDEPALYNRALTAEEILAIRQAGAAGKCKARPGIIVQPVSQRVTIGSNVTFNVVATGTPLLRYQWLKLGQTILGATNSTYSFVSQFGLGGNYSVRVTNLFGSVLSSNAVLTVNNPPYASVSGQPLSFPEDTAITFRTKFGGSGINAGGDSDDLDPLTFIIVTPPTNGTITLTASNLIYTPTLNFNGADSFSYKLNDGLADSNVETVRLNFWPVNDPPVAQSQIIATDEDTPLPIALGAFDVDGDAFTYQVTPPAHGTLSGTPPNLVYTPATNYFGDDLFTFTVSDPSNAVSQLAAVSITVRSVNDAPVAKIVLTPLDELPGVTNLVALAPVCCDATLRLDASESTDVENDPLTYVWLEGTNVLSTDVIATNRFKPGTHEITLLVSDGTDVTAASVTVEIITPAEAVAFLKTLVEAGITERRVQVPLVNWLREAGKAFERCHVEQGVRFLELFKQRVQERIAPTDAELATALIETATAIIEAAPDCDPCHRLGRHDHKHGKDRDHDERDGHDNPGQNERPEARPESPEVRAGQSSPKSR